MQRGATRSIPVSSSGDISLGVAAAGVRALHEAGTPALRHRGTLPAAGLPRAFDPFRFTQDRRQLTVAAVDDQCDPGGAGSLAFRAAQAQRAARANAAQQSCQAHSRSVIVDFDSNQSNVALFADCASSSGTIQAQATVGQMPLRLPDSITSIQAHRLLYAQIPSYELAVRLADGRNVITDPLQPIVANAAPAGCNEEQYTLTISEQYKIDARNQVVELLPDASIALPQTLTNVISLLQLRDEAIKETCCGCSRESQQCAHYVIETQCENEYLPGLIFYLLLGGGQFVKKHCYNCSEKSNNTCSEEETEENENKKEQDGVGKRERGMCDNNNKFDKLVDECCTRREKCKQQVHWSSEESEHHCLQHANDPLAPGKPTPCFEVLEVLDSKRFLARLIGTVTDTPPSFQAFLKRRCMRGQQGSTVFTTGGIGLAQGVAPQEYLWCDPFAEEQYNHCAEHYVAHYQVCSQPMLCQNAPLNSSTHGNVSQDACVRREAPCGGVVAYIPPPTSPCELADFTNCVVKLVREFILEAADNDECTTGGCGGSLHPIVDVSDVAYEPQTDTFIVKRVSGGFMRWRSLLNSRSHGDTSALNFPLRRRAMVVSETDVSAKERYLNAVFDGFFWFVVREGENDCFCIELCNKQRIRVCVPAGCYRADGFVSALEKAMNDQVPCHSLYRFCVRYSLFPVHALDKYIDEEVVQPKPATRTDSGFPSCRNEPYQVQAFAFTIENKKNQPFSLLFSESKGFAALVDFEPRSYNRRVRFVSRVLAPLQCVEKKQLGSAASNAQGLADCNSGGDYPLDSCQRRCAIGAQCAPCPRRRYRAFVDRQCGFTTLVQGDPSPIQCETVRPNSCDCQCEDNNSGCVWLRCNVCVDTSTCKSCCTHVLVEPNTSPIDRTTLTTSTDSTLPPPMCDNENKHDGEDNDDDNNKQQCRKAHEQATTTEKTENDDNDLNECDTPEEERCLPFCAGDVVWFQPKTQRRCECLDRFEDDDDDYDDDCCTKTTPLVGAVVLCVQQDPCNPCVHYVALHITMDKLVASTIQTSPVGFNLHLHPTLPVMDSKTQQVGSNEVLASQKGTVARWLGFTRPFTRSNCQSYTSNGAPQSILDERLLLRIPELVTLGLSEQRENHYQQLSPFDAVLTENYNVLSLDRPRGAYRFDAASAGPSLGIGMGLVPPTNVLAPPTSSQQICTPQLTFQLFRPDGTPYETGGFALAASLEIVYC